MNALHALSAPRVSPTQWQYRESNPARLAYADVPGGRTGGRRRGGALGVVRRPGLDLPDLAGFKLKLEEVLGGKVDVVTEKSLSPYLRERILEEAHPL